MDIIAAVICMVVIAMLTSIATLCHDCEKVKKCVKIATDKK